MMEPSQNANVRQASHIYGPCYSLLWHMQEHDACVIRGVVYSTFGLSVLNRFEFQVSSSSIPAVMDSSSERIVGRVKSHIYIYLVQPFS